MTLIKEKKSYFIIRKYFGSGVPVIKTDKYYVTFKSDFKILFSHTAGPYREDFTLVVKEKGLALYLNGLEIVLQGSRQQHPE